MPFLDCGESVSSHGPVSSVYWSVGVATVSERYNYLQSTLRSLAAAGWSHGITVLEDVQHLGPYPTFRLLLKSLVSRRCSHVLICQDDVQIAAGLRENIEQQQIWIPHEKDRIICSLFTAGGLFDQEQFGKWIPVKMPQKAWGAQAYIMPAAIAMEFLEHTPHQEWTDKVDHCIGLFCRDRDVKLCVPMPSLTYHTGAGWSTLQKGAGRDDDRQCRIWLRSLAMPEFTVRG